MSEETEESKAEFNDDCSVLELVGIILSFGNIEHYDLPTSREMLMAEGIKKLREDLRAALCDVASPYLVAERIVRLKDKLEVVLRDSEALD